MGVISVPAPSSYVTIMIFGFLPPNHTIATVATVLIRGGGPPRVVCFSVRWASRPVIELIPRAAITPDINPARSVNTHIPNSVYVCCFIGAAGGGWFEAAVAAAEVERRMNAVAWMIKVFMIVAWGAVEDRRIEV